MSRHTRLKSKKDLYKWNGTNETAFGLPMIIQFLWFVWGTAMLKMNHLSFVARFVT